MKEFIRYKLTIEYNGSFFSGWQFQDKAISVQGVLEYAANMLCGYFNDYNKSNDFNYKNLDKSKFQNFNIKGDFVKFLLFQDPKVKIFGSSRTDCGVHAVGQVAHVDLINLPEYKILMGLNFYINEFYMILNKKIFQKKLIDIIPLSVTKVEKVSMNFHSRFDAIKRKYIYKIFNRNSPSPINNDFVWWVNFKLDLDIMVQSSKFFLGRHDFSNFRNANCQSVNPIRTIETFDIVSYDEYGGKVIEFHIASKSFLHSQIRFMVGAIKKIGDKSLKLADIENLLQNKNSKNIEWKVAPSSGLFLIEVFY